MSTRLVVFILFFTSALYAQQNEPADYFPLKNNAVNKFLIPGSDGNLIHVTEKTIEKNGEFIINTTLLIAGKEINVQKVYAIKENSIYEVAYGVPGNDSLLTKHENPLSFLLFPIAKENKWSYTDEGKRKIEREIVDIITAATIMGKNYTSILKVKQTIYDGEVVSKHYQYYAKDIGLVSEELGDGKTVKYRVE